MGEGWSIKTVCQRMAYGQIEFLAPR